MDSRMHSELQSAFSDGAARVAVWPQLQRGLEENDLKAALDHMRQSFAS